MIAGASHFYQLGFVARDLDRATAALADRFGISRFRRKQPSDWLQTAHDWTGEVMIEVMKLGEGAPDLYAGFTPDDAAAVRLHHHGYRVADAAAWADVERYVAKAGWATPINGTAMNGDLRFMYVDTRADLGIYSEYVMLKGAAIGLYDDVPRN